MFRARRGLLLHRTLCKGHHIGIFSNLRPLSICHNVLSSDLSNEALSSCKSYAERFPPLHHPLPGVKLPSYLPDVLKSYPTKMTMLSNGLRVASENSPGHAACIGLYVACGSIYETEKFTGITHLLEKLAFKSTKNRSHLCVVREIEATGGNVVTSVSREQMAYCYDSLKNHIPEAVEILVDCFRNPLFLENEVKEQIDKVRAEIREQTKDSQQYLIEALHLKGYDGALGKSLVATEIDLDQIDASTVGRFYYENFTASRTVLAAYGMDHEELLALAEPLLHDMPREIPSCVPKSTYVGGDFRHREDSQSTHVALAFEVRGGWNQDKDATTFTVLQTLMGGGGSFSAGGPGKGMHSRLYLRVLNQYHQIQSFSAFSSIYDETGLFGIHFTTGSDFIERAVDVAVKELLAIATPGQVSEIELRRAKNATRSAVLMNLESRTIATEDMGRQILTYGCRKPVEHFLRCLDELTLDDITYLAQKMLTSPLSMACLGDVDRVPSYDSVYSHFKM